MSPSDLGPNTDVVEVEEAMAGEGPDSRPPRAGRVGPELRAMGERLRGRRQDKGLSLRSLSLQVGVSPSLISQVETGRASPSVATLYAMATALDLSVDDVLFGSTGPTATGLPTPGGPVQRDADRKQIRLASGVLWERLTTTSDSEVEFLRVTYEVGGASGASNAFQRHAGREWGHVLSGRLHVTIAFDDYVLEPGDSIAIDSSIPHRLWNDGDEPVQGIWFVLGRHDDDPRFAGGQESR